MKHVLAWHFVGATLRNGDPIPDDGVWLEYPGACVMCRSGLHASSHPFDALRYAPGATLCLVQVAQIEDQESDKMVCHSRKIIARMDAADAARGAALDAARNDFAALVYECFADFLP